MSFPTRTTGWSISRAELPDMTTTGHPAVHDPGPVRRVAARRQVDKQIRGSARTMQGPVSGGNRRTGISGAFPAEVAGCQVHEALLNVAFDAATPFGRLCPYDLEAGGRRDR